MSQVETKGLRGWVAVLALALAVIGAAEARAANVEDRTGYNTEYIFACTKAVVDSTVVMPLKPILMLLTIPTDIVLLPVALIGGLIG